MSVERNLALSILKLTKDGPAPIETITYDVKIPSETLWEMLCKLQNEELICLKQDSIEANSTDRLKLAAKAAALGADIENISDLLCWQEFEEMAALALRSNGYTVQKNVRFTHGKKRWEIDVVGCKKPLVICVDCKHWQKSISPSALSRMVNLQAHRTRALSEYLPNKKLNLECIKWEKAKFLPAVLSLLPSGSKFCDKVPIVPVLQFQDFICQLPAYTETLKFYSQTFRAL